MKILYVGSEAVPFASTGGLGDVIGSLPKAVKEASENKADVRVVLPLYGNIGEDIKSRLRSEVVFYVKLSWREQYCGVKSFVKDGITFYFIDNEYYFGRDGMYGHFDDAERFAYFCMAVAEMMWRVDFIPDIIHANDWQSAMCVVYIKLFFSNREGYHHIKTVFTIHNIEYQGRFSREILKDVLGIELEDLGVIEYDGCLNLMKGAITVADAVTTVSPKYAEEIKAPDTSYGLFHILRENSYKLYGILNGIDYRDYDPSTDREIVFNYSSENSELKQKNKVELQKELGLPVSENIPLIAVISRLTKSKGIDLICQSAYQFTERDIQLVVLGTGERGYCDFFRELEYWKGDRVRSIISYDRGLARRIYSAADIFLMPSASEPCGLSQMIASRYGAVPVCRETGGLYDSIKGCWIDNGEIKGNGFTFANYNAWEFLDRINAALEWYGNSGLWGELRKKVMNTDFSWKKSAHEYLKVYERIIR